MIQLPTYTKFFTPSLITIFVLALIVNIIAEIRENDLMRAYSKPFLIPMLIIYYVLMSPQTDRLIVIALLLAFNGDVALLFQNRKSWFRAGAIMFLLGHLTYFASMVLGTSAYALTTAQWLWPIIPAFVPAIIFFIVLQKHFGDFKTTAVLYMVAGSLLLYGAIVRCCCFSGWWFWLPLLGTAFFFFSDYLIARTRFKKDFKYSGALIMLTYVMAEVLLVIGLMGPF
jgi:uncharacterized membrane protein YhhN